VLDIYANSEGTDANTALAISLFNTLVDVTTALPLRLATTPFAL
jgi:hypothetical protein